MSAVQAKAKSKERNDSSKVKHKQVVPLRLAVKAGPARPVNAQAKAFYSAPPLQLLNLPVQAKVVIGRTNDPYECEADSVANRVVTGQSITSISTLPPGGLNSGSGAPAQRQDEKDESVQESAIQKQEDEKESVQSMIQREADDKEEQIQESYIQRQEDEDKTVQELSVQRQDEKEEPVQGKNVQMQTEEQTEEPVATQPLQRKEEEKPVQEFAVQRQAGEEEKPVQKLSILRQDEKDESVQESAIQKQEDENESVQSMIQRQDDEEPVQGSMIHREATDKDEQVQKASIQRQEDEESTVQGLSLQRQGEKEEQVQEAVQRQDAEKDESVQESAIQKQEDETEPVQSMIQRQDDEEPVQGSMIHREATDKDEQVQESYIQRQEDKESTVQELSLLRQGEKEEPVQELSLQRQADDDKAVQELPIQREEDGKEETVQSKELSPFRSSESDGQLENELKNSRGGGDALSPDVREPMEQRFGADFSGVRIHTDSTAMQMSRTLHAQAFTHGQHIYFNQGKFSPDTHQGRHLLAHELTHTVQQGASPSVKNQGASVNVNASHVQGGWIGEKLNKYARHVPGWDLITVIIGKNPLTGKDVDRNAKNFLGGVIGILPGGRALYDKLLEHGLIDSAFNWFKKKLSDLKLSWSRVKQAAEDAWDDMDFIRWDPFDYNLGVLKRHFKPLWNDVKTFASAVADKMVALVKEALLTPLVSFIKKRTRAYPLLTVILGEDPITGKEVDRNLYNIVSGFLMLTKSGEQYLAKLKESGSLEKLSKWMDTEIKKLNLGPKVIKKTFANAWNAIGIKSVIQPIKTFKKLYNIFSAPVKRLFRFVGNVAKKVLGIIKDWLIAKLKAYARKIPGYPLLSVILKKDPITGERVPRTAKNFIRGFMSLVPGGLKKYKDLEQSGAIDRALAWLTKAIRKLNLSWKMIVGLFTQAWDSLSINDLVEPIEAFKRIIKIFKPPVIRIINFVGAVALKIAEFIFIGVMGPTGERVLNILKKAKDTFIQIIKDPIGFARNLLAAVGKAFKQFSANIWKHLKAGLVGWLLGALQGAGLKLPEKLDFKGIISLALQVLGITYERIREKLVKHLGADAVAKLEKVFEFIKILVTEGPAGIWKKILEYVGNLKDMIIGGIKDWVVIKIITAAVTKIASMLNPVGAVIQAILAVYNTIMFFVERINQILDLVAAVTNSIANIVAAKIDAAANYVEQTMARTIPVIISFLARLIGLGNVSSAIMKVIKKIQAKVDMAIDKVVGFIVKKAKSLFGKGKSAVGKILDWWSVKKKFKSGKENHTIYFKGKGKSAKLHVASSATVFEQYLSQLEQKGTPKDKLKEIKEKVDEINALKVDPSTKKKVDMTKGVGKKIQKKMSELATLLAGADVGEARPKSNIIFTPTTKLGGKVGKYMKAEPLSIKPGKYAGSQPSEDSNLWKAVRIREGAYVRGHLLNHHLHGPGINKNLTPITGSLNQLMERAAERPAKEAVLGKNLVVSYTVDAAYGAQGSRKYIKGEEELITGLNLTLKQMRKKANATGDKESDWEIGQPQSKTGTKISDIDAPLSHDLPPDTKPGKHQPVNLSTANVDEIASVPNIGSIVAKRIYDKRVKRGKPFHVYKDLDLVEGLGETKLDTLIKENYVKLR